MSDEENKVPDGEEKAPVVYASPMKRIWAWVGVVYMVIIVLLFTYMLSFGAYLQGIGGIMVCPALGGVIASALLLWRTGSQKSATHRILLAAIVGLCLGLILLSLWNGIPALVAGFGV